MNLERRLQVFVSSTYTDLITERQAAVEAILEAGHIPAGMELFTAADETQWKIISQWINDSDIYMLLAGGRYGSLYPKSGRSYTEMEHRLARELKKPSFALLASERFLKRQVSTHMLSSTSADFRKARHFRESLKGNVVNFFDNADQVKLFTVRAIARLSERLTVGGWVRADADATAPGIDGAQFIFPRHWPVGHGYLPDIEERHNYRALSKIVHDAPTSILRMGSPYLLYWLEPEGAMRLEWLLTNTRHIGVEVVLSEATRLLDGYTEKRAIYAARCEALAKKHPIRITFKALAVQSDISYIAYPLAGTKGKASRMIVGLQFGGYQQRPFLEFCYRSDEPPPIVSAVLQLHDEYTNGAA
jgi:hypothetical protein